MIAHTVFQLHSLLHICFICALCYFYNSVIALATISLGLQWWEDSTFPLFFFDCTAVILSFLAKPHLSAITFWQWLSSFSQHQCTALSLLLYTWLVQNNSVGRSCAVWIVFFKSSSIEAVFFRHVLSKIVVVPILWTQQEHYFNYRWQ